jgi:hypothetical protein
VPQKTAKSLTQVEVNGKRSTIQRSQDGAIVLSGSSAPGKPLRWVLS